jgi:hypothetical protein
MLKSSIVSREIESRVVSDLFDRLSQHHFEELYRFIGEWAVQQGLAKPVEPVLHPKGLRELRQFFYDLYSWQRDRFKSALGRWIWDVSNRDELEEILKSLNETLVPEDLTNQEIRQKLLEALFL